MPDILQPDENPTPNGVDPQVFAKWVSDARGKLAAGKSLGPNEIPTGYEVQGNQLVQNTQLGPSILKGLAGTALGVAGGYGAGALDGLVNGASSVADLGTVSPLEFGGASAVAAPSAASGAGALLPSTQIGTGMISAAPSSVSSLAGPAAGLPDWLSTARNVGDALSSASAGRAQGRLLEGNANQQQNNAAVNLYNTELNAPRTIARNAVKGDVLANAQDVHINTPSTIPDFNISGGLRPSMFSDATRQTGRNISTAAANTPIPSPTAPILPDLPQAGGLDSFLNTASTISGLSRAVPPSAWAKIAGLF